MILSSFSVTNATGWAYLESEDGYNQPFPPGYVQESVTTEDGISYSALESSSPFFFNLVQNDPPYSVGKHVGIFRNIKPGHEAQVKSIFLRGASACGWAWAADLYYVYCDSNTQTPKALVTMAGPWQAGPGTEGNPTPILGYSSQHPTWPTTLGPLQIDLPYPIIVRHGDGMFLRVLDLPGRSGMGLSLTGQIIGRYVEVEN